MSMFGYGIELVIKNEFLDPFKSEFPESIIDITQPNKISLDFEDDCYVEYVDITFDENIIVPIEISDSSHFILFIDNYEEYETKYHIIDSNNADISLTQTKENSVSDLYFLKYPSFYTFKTGNNIQKLFLYSISLSDPNQIKKRKNPPPFAFNEVCFNCYTPSFSETLYPLF